MEGYSNMANDFSKRFTKPARNNGTYLFADFSEGLYLLDTPRSLGEQLASLALTGGRNVWAEKGSLVSQNGYMLKGTVPAVEKMVCISKDSKSSSSFFMVTLAGRVYFYTASEGLKLYKTELGEVSDNCLNARANNSLIFYHGGQATMFGSYYHNSEAVPIDENVPISDYGAYIQATVPISSKQYYWNGKQVDLGVDSPYTVIKTEEVIKGTPVKFALSKLSPTSNWVMKYQIKLDETDKTVSIDNTTNIKTIISTHEGSSSTVTTRKLKYQCYKATAVDERMVSIGSQPSGGYFYAIANPPVGYQLLANSGWTLASDISSLTSANWKVFGKTPAYAKVSQKSGQTVTAVGSGPSESGGLTSTVNFYNLTRYSGGDLYEIVTTTVTDPDYKAQQIQVNLPTVTNANQSFTSDYLESGIYDIVITNNPTDANINIKIMSGNTVVQESTLTDNALACSTSTEESQTEGITLYIDGELTNFKDESHLDVRLAPADLTQDGLGLDSLATISEKASIPIDLIYKPEASTGDITIVPTLMEVVNNRLFLVHTDGSIFYSAVGVYDNFSEAQGAGYFNGFYNDTSECLALDDYLNGVLITKQNGMYYATISSTMNTNSVTTSATVGLSVTKVSDVGQQYANDHIVVRNSVYAYDSNSCSLVLAVTQNYLGTIQAGKTIVSSDYLNAQDLGISSTRRHIVYIGESDCFILYYGEHLNKGLVLTNQGSLFPRELTDLFETYVQLNQSVIGITKDNRIVQDFQKGTVVLNVSPIAAFEAIGLRDNRCICSSLLEVSELHGVEYNITTQNATDSYQHIKPHINYGARNVELPPLIYSDKKNYLYNDSFELTSKWAEKKSNLTRIYAPMSGRNGVGLTLEFAKNQAFCLAALRLVDFSQGE